jgi:hypothetical protein
MTSFVFRNIQKDHIVPSRLKLRPLEKRAIDDENGVFWRSLNLGVDRLIALKIECLPDVQSIPSRSEWIEEKVSNGVQVSRVFVVAVGRETTLPVPDG